MTEGGLIRSIEVDAGRAAMPRRSWKLAFFIKVIIFTNSYEEYIRPSFFIFRQFQFLPDLHWPNSIGFRAQIVPREFRLVAIRKILKSEHLEIYTFEKIISFFLENLQNFGSFHILSPKFSYLSSEYSLDRWTFS